MNRLAVIFHGIVGSMDGRNGVGAPIDIQTCAKTIKHNILSHYNHDIFIHSWSTEHKDEILELYNPIKYIFEPQETFGYTFDENSFKDEMSTLSFRGISKYTSMERAMNLKTQYELENNFKYDWVLILRFDLIIFTKLELDKLDNNNFYICYEPHWPISANVNIPDHLKLLHDIIFLSSSNLMDRYCEIAQEIREGKYNHTIHAAHVIAWEKVRNMFNGFNNLKYGFKRYEDVEIYRFIMKPELNPVGHAYGALETPARLEALLKTIE